MLRNTLSLTGTNAPVSRSIAILVGIIILVIVAGPA